jgi:hypothetical protein
MDFKNPLRRSLGDALQPFVLLAALLGFLWVLSATNTSAEPGHRVQPVAVGTEQDEMQQRMDEVRSRLSAPVVSWEVLRRRVVDAARAEAGERESKLSEETATLATSMRAHLDREVPGSTERLARAIGVDGLASRIVRGVDGRTGWLPLGREKAAAFLASVAFHESSWRWRDRSLRGRRGEGCAFQIHPSTARLVGAQPEVIASDFGACLDTAIEVMRICSERCGDVPAEGWMGCYATAGTCGGAPEVVEQRFVTARLLLGSR